MRGCTILFLYHLSSGLFFCENKNFEEVPLLLLCSLIIGVFHGMKRLKKKYLLNTFLLVVASVLYSKQTDSLAWQADWLMFASQDI